MSDTPTPPSAVSTKGLRRVVIAMLVFVAIMLAVILIQGNHDREFMKTAEKGVARIVSKEERTPDPKSQRKEYWVTYSYTDRKHNTLTTQTPVEYPDLWKNLRQGYTVGIYYNKNNPAQSVLASVMDRRLKISGEKNVR